jgi:hypothetical protein
MSYTVTLTLSEDDCLNMRLALNMTACEWADKSLGHIQAGESDDAATCQRLRAKYHALWERVHDAQRLAEAEARADDMFASEARDPFGVALSSWRMAAPAYGKAPPREMGSIVRSIRAQNGLVD